MALLKIEGNGVWSTGFAASVESARATMGDGDVVWTVRIQQSGKFGMRLARLPP